MSDDVIISLIGAAASVVVALAPSLMLSTRLHREHAALRADNVLATRAVVLPPPPP